MSFLYCPFPTFILRGGEPNAQGCAFAHPIFGPLVNKMIALRTQNFGLSYKLRTQSGTHSAAPATLTRNSVFNGLFDGNFYR